MFRLFRLPDRIHKRPFVVSISVILTLAVISAALIFTLGQFGPGSNLMRVHVSSGASEGSQNGISSSVDGIGINLKYLPTANLLKNPSFENTQYDQIYTVSGGSENAVYVESDSQADSIYPDDFFVGGTVRIMSLDQDGQLIPKLQANITDFRTNQLGLWTQLAVPSGEAEGQKVTSVSSSSNLSVAVGDNGLLISDVTSSDPAILDIGITGNFVSSSCISDRFYAVTQTGSFAISSDGKTWNVFSPDETDLYSIHTVSSLGKIGVAAGDSGEILLCNNGKVTSAFSGTTQSLMTSAGDGNSIIIAGQNGTVLTTSNGIIFRALSSDEMPAFTNSPNWQCSDYRDGYFILGSDAGQIAIGSLSSDTGLYSFSARSAVNESGKPLSIKHVLLLSSGEIIVLDDEGLLYCSNDRGDTWKLLTVNSTKAIDEIGQTSTGKILLSQGVTSQTTQLFTRIQFDEMQSENVFQAGDMCFLQKSVPCQAAQTVNVSEQNVTASEKTNLTGQNDASVQNNASIQNNADLPADAALQTNASLQTDDTALQAGSSEQIKTTGSDLWQCIGEGTKVTMQELAPSGGGSSSLHIVGTAVESGDQAHFASQVISNSSDSPFQKSNLYQIKVWLKQDGISKGEVMAWISGKFASVGTTFTDVGSAWRQYTYTFFLPTEASGTNPGEIRFNIGFTGKGVLDVDKVYFGLQSNADSGVPDSFSEPVINSSPKLIRLDNIGIGEMGVSSKAWVLSSGNEGLIKEKNTFTEAGCNSLDTSLDLVHDAGSDPWLVIGSAADKSTIDNLMSYLCGSITDPFGKLRIENGTAVPWSVLFSRIVIEISDSNNIFSTDLQRGAYVDYMINLIQSSSYYIDNKDKFIFIDGMVYEGGTMLSQADYHASSLMITNQKESVSGQETVSFNEAVSNGYTSYFDLIPRTPSRPQQGADEWIRSSTLTVLRLDEKSKKSVTDTITAADCVLSLLSDLGDHTFTILPDLPVSKNGADVDTDNLFADQGKTKAEKLLYAQNNKTMLAVCKILSDSAMGTAAQVKLIPPIVQTAQGTAETAQTALEDSGLIMYGFKYKDEINTVVANTSDQPVLFLLEADWSIKDVYVYRYSSDGTFLEKTKLGQRNNRINLLPGQVIAAKIPMP